MSSALFQRGCSLGFALVVVATSGAAYAQLQSAILPSSRSVEVGHPATAFFTVINTAQSIAANCGLERISALSVPVTFGYQTTNPTTNQPTGTANTPVNIPPGGSQSFVFSITPQAAFVATGMEIRTTCTNAAPPVGVFLLNTIQVSSSATPIPDIIALVASNDPGYVNVPGSNGSGAFSVAAANVGVAGTIKVFGETIFPVPVVITICQTNAQAQCLSAPASEVAVPVAATATPTFSVFVQGQGFVADDPAHNRVIVQFKEVIGGVDATRGAASIAVRTK